jgi:hypothetical protein
MHSFSIYSQRLLTEMVGFPTVSPWKKCENYFSNPEEPQCMAKLQATKINNGECNSITAYIISRKCICVVFPPDQSQPIVKDFPLPTAAFVVASHYYKVSHNHSHLQITS